MNREEITSALSPIFHRVFNNNEIEERNSKIIDKIVLRANENFCEHSAENSIRFN